MRKIWNRKRGYVLGYGITMVALVTVFTLLYQSSYQRKVTEQIEGMGNVLRLAEKSIEENYAVYTQTVAQIKPDTEYILETYNLATGEGFTETLSVPPEMVGLGRSEVISYLNEYMMELPLEEYEKGLLSCELVSFSENKIVLKKTYNSDAILYKYYIMVEDNVVVVYYCDKKTVYEYTGISASDLNMEERVRLSKGIGVETEEELYGILENYSS